MDEVVESLMSEIRGRLELIESSLPHEVDALAVSPTSRLPFMALTFRETLIWRMAELSRSAYEEFIKERLSAAILLTRGAVETSAALWYLDTKVSSALKAEALGDIAQYLMQLFGGHRAFPDLPQAISVLTFVGCVEKRLEGFRHQYDLLSEFAHPNWAGTTGLYSKINYANAVTDYGSNPRRMAGPKGVGVTNLSVALAMFELSYNHLSDVMPAFVALCEAALKHPPIDDPETE